VSVIVVGGSVAVLAAKAATTTIPIVFSTGGDPVKLGLVASFNRPGGNMTGVGARSAELGPKRLGFLRALLPNAVRIAVLANLNKPVAEAEVEDLLAAGRSVGFVIDVVNVSNERDIDRFFATLAQSQVSALFLTADILFARHMQQIVALAADHAIPAMYFNRQYTVAGGLMSYGISSVDAFRQAGLYVGRILKGEKPADLPVMQLTNFDLAINLKTAKALGLTIPPNLLALADEVIE
jgi:putative tryptophan/tyrosine transport system substrate-binding protein